MLYKVLYIDDEGGYLEKIFEEWKRVNDQSIEFAGLSFGNNNDDEKNNIYYVKSTYCINVKNNVKNWFDSPVKDQYDHLNDILTKEGYQKEDEAKEKTWLGEYIDKEDDGQDARFQGAGECRMIYEKKDGEEQS